MSLKLVIFDVDGLLLDTERVWQDVWYDTARDFGIDDWKREDFLNVVGRSGQPVYDYMEELFRGRCSTEEFMKVARQHGVERLERELTAKPGAVELLNCIKKAGLPCAVATATSRSLTEERLTRLQLIQYFDYICCGDEVVERKPFAGSVPEGACEDEYSTGGCTGFRRLEGGRPGSLECQDPGHHGAGSDAADGSPEATGHKDYRLFIRGCSNHRRIK